jgi:hypothetical protein
MLIHVLLVLALLAIALLLGATVYESVVMAPNYERDIPDSINTARAFLTRTTPARFFRVISPVTEVLLALSALVGWSTRTTRMSAGGALLVLILLDVITFTFHYPRLAIMFKSVQPIDADRVRRAARQWAQGNIVRAVLLAGAFLAVLHALMWTRGWMS